MKTEIEEKINKKLGEIKALLKEDATPVADANQFDMFSLNDSDLILLYAIISNTKFSSQKLSGNLIRICRILWESKISELQASNNDLYTQIMSFVNEEMDVLEKVS